MIKEYGIKDQEYRMWYRGQADYEWGLIPSVQRPEYHKKGNEQVYGNQFLRYMIRSADLIKS